MCRGAMQSTYVMLMALCGCQVRLQSECVRHEDLVENTTSWLRDFQARFNLRTRAGFPIEARAPRLPAPQA